MQEIASAREKGLSRPAENRHSSVRHIAFVHLIDGVEEKLPKGARRWSKGGRRAPRTTAPTGDFATRARKKTSGWVHGRDHLLEGEERCVRPDAGKTRAADAF
jgi:hypothetical protein